MTIYGMAAAYTFTQALQHAGRHPTRNSIVAAVNGGAVNSSGPALLPLEDSPTDHDGYPGEQIGRIENGKLLAGLLPVRSRRCEHARPSAGRPIGR